MNLAIRGIDSSNVRWSNEGSFLNDAHKDLKADFILANPPFNDSDWSGELLQKDARWQYGVPPAGNANYAWVQHFLFHLSTSGIAGFVLSKGSLTTKSGGEYDIRKSLLEKDLVACIVNLPTKLFLNTQIPACLWLLQRNKKHRKKQTLFIDARNMGHLINRRNRELSEEDIAKIAGTYHKWKDENDGYMDVKGFCKNVPFDEIMKLDYVLTPGRYVGLPDEEDDFNFEERFAALKAELEKQMGEEVVMNKRIIENLNRIKV